MEKQQKQITETPPKVEQSTFKPKLDQKIDYQKFDLNIFSTIKRSWLTEKVYKQINDKNIYVFEVSKDANASQIKHDFQILFNVKVEKVNIVKVKPRKKRLGKYQGWKPSTKKAYIKLAKGEKISVFQEDFKEIKEDLAENKENQKPDIDLKAKETPEISPPKTTKNKE